MNEKQKAIKSSSKVISVIMQIGYIAMIVEMCICVCSLIFLAITGGKTSLITSGGIRIVALGEALTTGEGAVALCVAALIVGGFLFAIFLLAQRMFGEISATGTPFNAKYVRTIKTIGILVAAMTIVCNIADTIASACAGVATLGMQTDATGIIFGVLIFCLAYIFDYGCALQQQSDETL